MMRKTVNPDCLNFDLLARRESIPNCEAFDYDEGVVSIEFCISRCLDLAGCLQLVIDAVERNCSYHACTDYSSEQTTKLLVIKDCLSECPSPVTQLCLNCQQGPQCQSYFHNVTTSDGSTCRAMCDTDASCEGALYDSSNMECQLFQCPYVAQQYGSMFYRTSCNTDCPVYEICILEGYAGTCEVIATMTENFVVYPDNCYKRCLDTHGCRGVTYVASHITCYYHSCDCHGQNSAALGFTFMWKYCLEDESSPTILPQTNDSFSTSDSIIDIYPTSPGCKPKPIYIMSCLCSTGAFANSTSASVRKQSSAEDNRSSSVAVGTVGIALLACMGLALFAMDFPNLITTLKQIYKKIKKLTKPKKTTDTILSISEPSESLRHPHPEDVGRLKEQKSERRLSVVSLE